MDHPLLIRLLLALLCLASSEPAHELLHHGPGAGSADPVSELDELHDSSCAHFDVEAGGHDCLSCAARHGRHDLPPATVSLAGPEARAAASGPEGSHVPRKGLARGVLGARGPPRQG